MKFQGVAVFPANKLCVVPLTSLGVLFLAAAWSCETVKSSLFLGNVPCGKISRP